MVIVKRGFAERVVEVARKSGATGATIIHGRGKYENQKVMLPIINLEVQPEKEIILLITSNHISASVVDSLLACPELNGDGEIKVFMSPTEAKVETLVKECIPSDNVVDGLTVNITENTDN